MKISIVGMFLCALGVISLVFDATVVAVNSLQQKMFVWESLNWTWLVISAGVIAVGLLFAYVGYIFAEC